MKDDIKMIGWAMVFACCFFIAGALIKINKALKVMDENMELLRDYDKLQDSVSILIIRNMERYESGR